MVNKICLSVLLSMFLFAGSGFGADRPQPLRVGDALPSRTLPSFSGPALTIPDQVKGSVAVVHFWTDTCGSCREEMPVLERLYKQYRQKGLQIVAVNVGQQRSTVQKFLESVKVSYPVLLDQDMGSRGWYGVIGLPRTYIVDRKGVVRYKLIGEASEETLRKLLAAVL